MGRKPAKMCVNAGFVPFRYPDSSHQDLPGYEQKSHEADVSGEWAADHEASPEDGAEVDGELGQG